MLPRPSKERSNSSLLTFINSSINDCSICTIQLYGKEILTNHQNLDEDGNKHPKICIENLNCMHMRITYNYQKLLNLQALKFFLLLPGPQDNHGNSMGQRIRP